MKRLFTYRRKHLFAHAKATIAVRRELSQLATGPHNHDFIELVIVISGTALHRVGRVCHRLASGDVFVINRRRSHSYEEPDALHLANILIHEDVFTRIHPSIGALPGYHTLFAIESCSSRSSAFESRTHFDAATLAEAINYLDCLEAESLRPLSGGSALAEAWLILLIGLISRNQPFRPTASAPASSRLGRLLSWLEKDSHQPVTIADMARIAAMSERTLLRKFREATGQSPLGYLISLRLRKARRMLEASPGPLTNEEIAVRCGFENGNYLARQFRKNFGVAPQAWARARRKS